MNILHLSRMMSQGGAQKIVYQLATGCKKKDTILLLSPAVVNM